MLLLFNYYIIIIIYGYVLLTKALKCNRNKTIIIYLQFLKVCLSQQ